MSLKIVVRFLQYLSILLVLRPYGNIEVDLLFHKPSIRNTIVSPCRALRNYTLLGSQFIRVFLLQICLLVAAIRTSESFDSEVESKKSQRVIINVGTLAATRLNE